MLVNARYLTTAPLLIIFEQLLNYGDKKMNLHQNHDDRCNSGCNGTGTVDAVRADLPAARRIQELADLFKALGDATRLRLLLALSLRELCVCELAEAIGMSVSAVSHQLRYLRAARIVKYRRAGKLALYSLDDEHVATLLCNGLDHVVET